jgi:Tol biopolymer transport system component
MRLPPDETPRSSRPRTLPRSWQAACGLGTAALALVALVSGAASPALANGTEPDSARTDTTGLELPTHEVPNLGPGAEFYFSPDGTHLVGNAKRTGDSTYHVYTLGLDGEDIHKVNDQGSDACSFYYPDGKRVIWTSTRDHLEFPAGNYSDPNDYPQGAELYASAPDGSNPVRLTNNAWYDAEVTISPDGSKVLFSRQIDGKLDLWIMRPDGGEAHQITHTDSWQEGGAGFLPDNHTIIYRAWHREDQGKKSPLPMEIFTIRDDGTGLRQVTSDSATNWAPYPAPDGHHFFFVRVLPPHNFEIYLGDLESPELKRITWNDAFDGFPAVSPDGHWLAFGSSRAAAPGTRSLRTFLMDISSLHLGSKPAH